MRPAEEEKYIEVAKHFVPDEIIVSAKRYGSGNINSTVLVQVQSDQDGIKKYILQAINTEIFKNPTALMNNIVLVTSYLKEQIVLAGGNPKRETLTPIGTDAGVFLYRDESGAYWRMYEFIEDAVCLEQSENVSQFYETGRTFGHFQYMMKDFPAACLVEVLQGFHDTPARFEALKQAVKTGNQERCQETEKELAFCLEREKDAGMIAFGLQDNTLPLRVTHNDTKLSNIMLDKDSYKGICVIDLDTVMPGSALYDYGDAIRSGANTAAEDETNLDKVSCSIELFEAFTKGFVKGCRKSLTAEEIRLFVRAAWTMTLEQAVRFLSDYLMDDVYYRIRYKKHNLDRTRNQLKLVYDIEGKWQQLEEIAIRAVSNAVGSNS